MAADISDSLANCVVKPLERDRALQHIVGLRDPARDLTLDDLGKLRSALTEVENAIKHELVESLKRSKSASGKELLSFIEKEGLDMRYVPQERFQGSVSTLVPPARAEGRNTVLINADLVWRIARRGLTETGEGDPAKWTETKTLIAKSLAPVIRHEVRHLVDKQHLAAQIGGGDLNLSHIYQSELSGHLDTALAVVEDKNSSAPWNFRGPVFIVRLLGKENLNIFERQLSDAAASGVQGVEGAIGQTGAGSLINIARSDRKAINDLAKDSIVIADRAFKLIEEGKAAAFNPQNDQDQQVKQFLTSLNADKERIANYRSSMQSLQRISADESVWRIALSYFSARQEKAERDLSTAR